MYFQNAYYEEAVQELSYVVKGGMSTDGHEMEAIQLVPNSGRIAEYYYTYAAALSYIDQCGEALQIVQLILSRIPADELALDSANKTTNRCQENLDAPPSTPTVDAAATEVEATPTP
jgi:hypothetical protein